MGLERLQGGLLLISTFFLQVEIKNHVFFSPINWDDLYHKRLTPPFNPNVVRGHHNADSGLSGLVGVCRASGPTLYRWKKPGSKGLHALSKVTWKIRRRTGLEPGVLTASLSSV